MQLLNYFLASFLSWAGIIAGIILMKIAPEEKNPMAKAFIFVSKISLVLAFCFTLFYYYSSTSKVIALVVCAVLLLIPSRNTSLQISPHAIRKMTLNYSVLGVIFYFSLQNSNLFLINSSLIFIYGAAKASELFDPRKNNLRFAFHSLIFVLIANFLFLIKQLL